MDCAIKLRMCTIYCIACWIFPGKVNHVLWGLYVGGVDFLERKQWCFIKKTGKAKLTSQGSLGTWRYVNAKVETLSPHSNCNALLTM